MTLQQSPILEPASSDATLEGEQQQGGGVPRKRDEPTQGWLRRRPMGAIVARNPRQTLAEEQYWRASPTRSEGARRGWYPKACWGDPTCPPDYEKDPPPEPDEIAGLYRGLRKGREDAKDEPGAADFYYGEMEMRRLAKPSAHTRGGRRLHALAEQGVLTGYWLGAGYGQRASRALLGLLVTTIVFGFLLWWLGFAHRPTLTRAILFSAESTSSLFRVTELPKQNSLTYAGETLQLALRLIGPLFFGLTILALRGRVKR